MRKRRAFTLVEIVISILILGIVMAAVLGLFSSIFKSYEFHQEVDVAKERGISALAVIRRYVMNAGLGLPVTKDVFQSVFLKDEATRQTQILPVDETKWFTGSVQLAASDDKPLATGTEAPQLWIVYSVPSGAGVREDYNLSAKTTQVIPVDRFSSLDAANKLSETVTNLKAWISFPGSMSAFRIMDIDSTNEKISLQSAITQKISAFDEIHYIRAAKIKVRSTDNMLVVDDLDGSGAQPLIQGIVAMTCSYDPDDDRVLKVSVLARADTSHSEEVTASVDGWAGTIPDRHYRYAVVTRSWRIRN